MSLAEELERVAAAAAHHAGEAERLAAVLPTEPHSCTRVYLCAYEGEESGRTWLAVDDAGGPVADRGLVRDAVTIFATCELAEESAGGGDLEELQQQLVALRLTESPEGIEEAETAVLALQRVIGAPRARSRRGGPGSRAAAARELEHALGGGLQPSPFAEAMRAGRDAVDALLLEVEGAYRGELR